MHLSPARAAAALLIGVLSTSAFGQIPPGYYDSVDTSNPTTLRATLHDVIDNHVRYPYTSGATDTWDILELADADPANSGNIIDLYKNASYPKQGGGNSFYDREHSWPSSYGFPDNNSSNYPFSDCFMLFLCDSSYNSARSNKPFRFCAASHTEYPTNSNGGAGGGTGVYPGNSNWTAGAFTQGTWETWIDRRGDVARALFYADVRYEGGFHQVTAAPEPNLILTDNEFLIDQSNTGNNESVAYMGMLQALLTWHQQDPVDAREQQRNEIVSSFQGNRNPFIDHPEWADCLFSGSCSGTDVTPPAAPTALVAAGQDGSVALSWADNLELDLAGYNVYRSNGGGLTQQNGALVGVSDFLDGAVTNGVTYTYQVTAVDNTGNESVPSGVAIATPSGGGPVTTMPWINEFHYDNTSTDAGEFAEIAGPAGTDLAGWSLVGYNGNGGATYQTIALSGVIPDQGAQIGTLWFVFTGMQNGAPDGLALVDDQGSVVEFLSYEGSVTAVGGPASGLTSVNVGVTESSATPIGFSLQRAGTGAQASEFTWQVPGSDTPGQPNNGQVFDGGETCQLDLGFGNHPTAMLSACGGDLSTGNDSTLTLSGLPAAAGLFLAFGVTNSPTVVPELDGATLVPLPFLLFLSLPNPGTGSLSVPVPGGAGPISLYVQYILQEVSGLTTSNAVQLDLLP